MSAEQEDVAVIREDALTWLRGRRSDDGKTEDIINGLLSALERAEREWDEWRSLFKVEKHERETVERERDDARTDRGKLWLLVGEERDRAEKAERALADGSLAPDPEWPLPREC